MTTSVRTTCRAFAGQVVCATPIPLRPVTSRTCRGAAQCGTSFWRVTNDDLFAARVVHQLSTHLTRSRLALCRAYEQGNSGSSRDPSVEDYIEVKVDSVRVSQGASVVFLRILDGRGHVLPVHIGENESNALLKEINKQKQLRPLTHDVMKNILSTLHFRVSRIRITDIVANTYYARIFLARVNNQGQIEPDTEVEVDARPSDAINLAVRFGAPMYVNRKIAESACASPPESHTLASTSSSTSAASSNGETHADIARSVRDALASFEDPTIMYQLQKDLAIQEQRYEEARKLQQTIMDQMLHNQMLRLVVAMEAALTDGRYDEAARLRDEYRKLVAAQAAEQRKGGYA